MKDTIRLLRLAIEAKEFHLSKELLRFLHSIDESGSALRQAIAEVGIVPEADLSDLAPKIEISRPQADHDEPASSPANRGNPVIISPVAVLAAPPKSHMSAVTSPHPNLARQVQIRNTDRVSSPFQLDSPRLYESPPSPRTVLVPSQGGSPLVEERGSRLPDAPEVPEEAEDEVA